MPFSTDEVARMWAAHVLNEYDHNKIDHPHLHNARLIQSCESAAERLIIWSIELIGGSLPEPVISQHWISVHERNYRVDFAVPDAKIAIEVDGHKYHSSKSQRTKDAERDRALQSNGWRVFRFTGSEIYADPKRVAVEFLTICNSSTTEG